LDRSERGLIFSHQRHLDRGAHCPVCHRAPDHGQEEVRPGGAHSTLSATACLACHEGQKHPAHCTLCHRNRAQIEPQSHEAPNWLRAHGPAGRQPQGCYDCHAEEDCRNCHEVQVPHPSGFLARHGAEAKAHERACNLCHLSRECQACHGVSLPHPPGFDRHHRDAAEQRQVCRKCHAQRMCQDCHRRSNPHPANWRRLHGGKKESRTGSCETCHTRQYCRNCHGLEMPHPRDWLLVGHRIGASFKAGSVCFRCHEKDYCAKCHVET
jgi:hypothetical protein